MTSSLRRTINGETDGLFMGVLLLDGRWGGLMEG